MIKTIDVQTPWINPDREGRFVETQWLGNVKGISSYNAVIIGSAIQYDKWMPQATEFVLTNQNVLEKMSVAYFFTGMTLSKRNKRNGASSHGIFGYPALTDSLR